MATSHNKSLKWSHPAKLFLEVTTRCNLRCKMCVKQSSGNGIMLGDLAVSTFEALKPAIAKLDRVIISGVGEPLLHPLLEDFILDIKTVLPVCFGHLESLPLTDIWNLVEFKNFRKDVLLYDYPYCGDCGLSPCDYIDSPLFEHDCHTNTVPCCDCPWSGGILNCLQ